MSAVDHDPPRSVPSNGDDRDSRNRRRRPGLWLAVSALARQQHGVVRRGQLRDLGLTDEQIDGALRRGWLIAVHRAVFAVGHTRLSFEGRASAAVLACGSSAAAGYRTGAALWSLRPSSTPRIEVVIPRRSAIAHRGVVIHRHPTVLPDELTVHDGVPVTSVARTLLDLAAVVPREQLRNAIKQAEVLGLFDLAEVNRLLVRHPRHRGTVALRSVLKSWTDPLVTRSDLEIAFVDLCTRHGLPTPLMNGTVLGMEIDAQFPAHGIAIELDGGRFHENSLQREDDYAKRATVEAAGLRFVAFTYRQVTDHGGTFPARILQQMVARRS